MASVRKVPRVRASVKLRRLSLKSTSPPNAYGTNKT